MKVPRKSGVSNAAPILGNEAQRAGVRRVIFASTLLRLQEVKSHQRPIPIPKAPTLACQVGLGPLNPQPKISIAQRFGLIGQEHRHLRMTSCAETLYRGFLFNQPWNSFSSWPTQSSPGLLKDPNIQHPKRSCPATKRVEMGAFGAV